MHQSIRQRVDTDGAASRTTFGVDVTTMAAVSCHALAAHRRTASDESPAAQPTDRPVAAKCPKYWGPERMGCEEGTGGGGPLPPRGPGII